jgi:predicted transcriptional regulator
MDYALVSIDMKKAPEMARTENIPNGAAPEKPLSFVALLDTFTERLVPRTKAIVEARFGLVTGKMKTLEEIGNEYGITRERVRQILSAAFSSVKQHRDADSFMEASSRIEAALRDRSGIMGIPDLLGVLADGQSKERGALSFFLECLKTVKEERETADRVHVYRFAAFPETEWDVVIARAESVLLKSGEILSENELYGEAKKSGIVPDKKIFFDYLAVASRIEKNTFGLWGFSDSSEISPRGTREKAYLVLKMEGKPLHFKEIAARIDESGLQKKGKKTHPQTVHNELIKDKKFVLVGRGLYALAEWGYSRGTVKEVLDGILRTAGKPMKRSEILDAVFRVRTVKRSTIIINLNASFEKIGKDVYTVRGVGK